MTSAGKIASRLDSVFHILAWGFSIFLAISIFTFILPHRAHYSVLLSGVVLLSAVLCLRDVLRDSAEKSRRGGWARIIGSILVLIAAIVSTTYLGLNAQRLEIEQPFLNRVDVIMGFILLFAVLGLNWFYWGGILTAIIVASIAYFIWGHWLEHPVLKHQPYDLAFVISYMGMNTTEGLFAYLPDGVEKLYFLVLFSAVLIGSGMIGLVVELGKYLGRFIRGGASFPAIIGSTLVGSVMGAAVTNVILTGRITIPVMKKNGFRASFAGAIEAAASTAGQIMPPVMGLAAFIMAAFLNIPYITVAMIAVIPSFLYMVGVTIAVLMRARKDGLETLKEEVNLRLIGRLLPTFLLPFIIILGLMLLFYSPSFAGFFGILAVLGLAFLQGPFRPSLGQINAGVKEGFEVVMQLSLLLLAIGPLAQAFVTTNMAGRLSAVLINFFPENQIFLLFTAMALALFLGMGLPTPAAYVLCALTLGHFLQEAGVEGIPAHFFIQYFAVFSALTPPVALASMAASKVAMAGFVETAKESIKLVLPAFFVPFAFIYHPELLSFPNISFAVLIPISAVIAVQWNWSIAIYGYLGRPLSILERIVFLLVCAWGLLFLFSPQLIYYYVLMAACAVEIVLWKMMQSRSSPVVEPS